MGNDDYYGACGPEAMMRDAGGTVMPPTFPLTSATHYADAQACLVFITNAIKRVQATHQKLVAPHVTEITKLGAASDRIINEYMIQCDKLNQAILDYRAQKANTPSSS